MTSRIDRLPPELQLFVKVASVLGRTFELDALRAVHPGAAAWEDLAQRLGPLQERTWTVRVTYSSGDIGALVRDGNAAHVELVAWRDGT